MPSYVEPAYVAEVEEEAESSEEDAGAHRGLFGKEFNDEEFDKLLKKNK